MGWCMVFLQIYIWEGHYHLQKLLTDVTERRQREGGGMPSARLVADRGTTRSTPGLSHTTQAR
ncbi:MAG: hypothetical protein M3Q29_16100, partial [Chloroflexota bacterium]|nr:hypothetical protein [Chloroflexota bacterium]